MARIHGSVGLDAPLLGTVYQINTRVVLDADAVWC